MSRVVTVEYVCDLCGRIQESHEPMKMLMRHSVTPANPSGVAVEVCRVCDRQVKARMKVDGYHSVEAWTRERLVVGLRKVLGIHKGEGEHR